MGARFKQLLMVSMAAAVPAGLAHAQVATQPARPPVAAPVRQAPAAQAPAAQIPVAQNPAIAVPAPTPPSQLPPPYWDPAVAQELLAFIAQIGTEGLTPADYDPTGLAAAIASRNPGLLAQVATDRFNRVSSDLAFGHVRGKDRVDWHVPDNDLDPDRQRLLLVTALAQRRIGDALRGLLPTHPQYRDLRNALAMTAATDTGKINRIRLNMDRWRWLPRDLGQKYIIVNVPAYYVALVENGQTRWRQRAVAGAVKTPTPMLTAMASGVILNPWWEVPKSIEPEVRGKAGYVALRGKDGKIQRWRQPPGPSNALGELKFVMPNSKAIFLHDTNARSRFNANIRSLSHGCIRTQHIVDLATELLTDDGGPWSKEKVRETLASKKTVQASFVKPLPVYIVYFSSAAATDGRIINYSDVYRRDAKVLAALNDVGPAGAKTAGAR